MLTIIQKILAMISKQQSQTASERLCYDNNNILYNLQAGLQKNDNKSGQGPSQLVW